MLRSPTKQIYIMEAAFTSKQTTTKKKKTGKSMNLKKKRVSEVKSRVYISKSSRCALGEDENGKHQTSNKSIVNYATLDM